jgi:hypothetical protein
MQLDSSGKTSWEQRDVGRFSNIGNDFENAAPDGAFAVCPGIAIMMSLLKSGLVAK